mgnify:CR=1 FL=1
MVLMGACNKTPGPASLNDHWHGKDDSTKVVAKLVVDTAYANGGQLATLSLDSTKYPVLVSYNPTNCKGTLFYENESDSLGKIVLNDSSNLVGQIRGETDDAFRMDVYRQLRDSAQTVLHLFSGSMSRAD